MKTNRREFLKTSAIAAGGVFFAASTPSLLFGKDNSLDFQISLAQWSLNRAIFGGEMDNLDFPIVAKKEFDISAVEYVNQFFMNKAEDTQYLTELKNRADDNGVKNLLIMIDREGALSATDDDERNQAVENHYKWVDAAKFLGCHSIRVNLNGDGNENEWVAASVEGLGKLAEYGKKNEVSIIVENHGGYSSDAGLLRQVMEQIEGDWHGTLPDFGNFCIEKEDPADHSSRCINQYDIYKGVKELMPYAKGVSAKSYDFDEAGNETTIDFRKMLEIVRESGFQGYIGVEYEGNRMSEPEGIKATKSLLEKVKSELAEK